MTRVFPTFARNGDLIIGSRSGRVYRLPPPYREPQVLLDSGDYPHSIALRGNELWIAETGGLYRAPYYSGQTKVRPQDLKLVKKHGNTVFLCGNGGSAANSLHIANDFVYGIGGAGEQGIKAQALAANQSLLTCLANDIGYDEIFSYQLKMLAKKGDLLIVFSGSGNSPNIINSFIC